MRLLLVEDSLRLRAAIAAGVRKAGFVVDEAGDGEEALQRAESVAYAVVVLDLMLPKLDGLSVLRSLRAAGNEARILVLSARDSIADRVRGIDVGADDYLVKPFAFDELLARIRNLCRRPFPAPCRRLVVADLEVDLEARIARRAGVLLKLSPREFTTLEFFALRQGRVVSRAQLEAQLFDDGVELKSNVVDAMICRLRSKVDLPGRRTLIHTRRGAGYAFGIEA
jgi:DNA-binding response OmpR family regulator